MNCLISSAIGPNQETLLRANRKLIVNADDFGLSRAVSDGIIWAARHGIVTSTSFLANMAASDYALQEVGSLDEMPSVGIHFNLSQGRPLCNLSDVRTLVDSSGCFLSPEKVFRKALKFGYRLSEIRTEFEAQCQFMVDRGFQPTHADLHHFPFPQVFQAALGTARKFGIRSFRTYRNRLFVDSSLGHRLDLRMKCAIGNIRLLPKRSYYRALNSLASSVFGLKTADRRLSEARMMTDPTLSRMGLVKRLFANCPVGTNEWVCHPGFSDPDSPDDEFMRAVRASDLEIVCSEDLPELLRKCGIKLVSHSVA